MRIAKTNQDGIPILRIGGKLKGEYDLNRVRDALVRAMPNVGESVIVHLLSSVQLTSIVLGCFLSAYHLYRNSGRKLHLVYSPSQSALFAVTRLSLPGFEFDSVEKAIDFAKGSRGSIGQGHGFDDLPETSQVEIDSPGDFDGTQLEASIRNAGLPQRDFVHFAIAAPTSVQPGNSFVLDVWAFEPHLRKKVLTIINEESTSKTRVKSIGPHRLERGAVVTVSIVIDSMTASSRMTRLHWGGDYANATAAFHVDKGVRPGPRVGKAIFRILGLEIARLDFQMHVHANRSSSRRLANECTSHRTGFASYASEDRAEVLKRVQGIEKAGVRVFVDVNELRSGQNYSDVLAHVLTVQDVFYLFWSSAASRSKWVEFEWKSALAARGISYIDPVPLVSPNEVPPPAELGEALHFDDWMLAYLSARESKPSE